MAGSWYLESRVYPEKELHQVHINILYRPSGASRRYNSASFRGAIEAEFDHVSTDRYECVYVDYSDKKECTVREKVTVIPQGLLLAFLGWFIDLMLPVMK